MTARDVFITGCMKWINVPYRWGGEDPVDGADCSGFVEECLEMAGLDPSGRQTADAFYRYFKQASKGTIIPKDKHQIFHATESSTGCLVFYGTETKVTHVGLILVGKIMIEAGGGSSSTNSLAAAVAANAFVRLRPYNRRKDIVAIIRPTGLPF
jgi:cell wall-associated NlpC family hydrolase